MIEVATKTAVSQRTRTFLDIVQGEVEDLARTAAEWRTRLDLQQAEFALEWGHLMSDFLTELDDRYRSGQMADEQCVQYRHILGKLKALAPTIRQLNLDAPPGLLEP
jgi:hypothetical protein